MVSENEKKEYNNNQQKIISNLNNTEEKDSNTSEEILDYVNNDSFISDEESIKSKEEFEKEHQKKFEKDHQKKFDDVIWDNDDDQFNEINEKFIEINKKLNIQEIINDKLEHQNKILMLSYYKNINIKQLNVSYVE